MFDIKNSSTCSMRSKKARAKNVYYKSPNKFWHVCSVRLYFIFCTQLNIKVLSWNDFNISIVRTITNKKINTISQMFTKHFQFNSQNEKQIFTHQNLFLSSGVNTSMIVKYIKGGFSKNSNRYNSFKLIFTVNEKPRKILFLFGIFYLLKKVDKYIYFLLSNGICY